MKPKILTDQKAFEELWKVVHGTRESSETIKVPREKFVNLLMDHSELIGYYERKNNGSSIDA